MFTNSKNLIIATFISIFTFACSGSPEYSIANNSETEQTETGQTETSTAEETASNDSGPSNDTNDSSPTIDSETVDSGPMKNDSGALIVDGKCIPKTKDQIEKDYTTAQNEKTLSTLATNDKSLFGGYEQFYACGLHQDGCGGTIDFGADACPEDPSQQQDSGIVRTQCQANGFCYGTCAVLADKSRIHEIPEDHCFVKSSTIWVGEFLGIISRCLIKPRNPPFPNYCWWGKTNSFFTAASSNLLQVGMNHWCCHNN